MSKYKLSDEIVHNELKLVCFKQQIDGYPFGAQQRVNFIPIVPMEFDVSKNEKGNEIHIIAREKTLKLPEYTSFTQDQVNLLLETELEQEIENEKETQ